MERVDFLSGRAGYLGMTFSERRGDRDLRL